MRDMKQTFKLAGAFIAWVIGSGFATGQEVMQFFTSFGVWSYGIVAINLVGFLLMGQVLMTTGYENRKVKDFNHFKYFCGEKLGGFYTALITGTLFLIMAVLISGAGATLSEYYGLPTFVGSAIMAAMVLAAYLVGFERLVQIVSSIGPVIIVFSLLVGTITVFTDMGNLDGSLNSEGLETLSKSQAAPHWIISAILYVSLNFISGSSYFTALGMSAASKKEARNGAILGALALILSIGIMNTAILINAENAAELAIPVLYLAKKISYALGAIFSIVLILGMFSSCSAMMWTVCSKYKKDDKKKNSIFAVLVAIITFVLSLFSFSDLIGLFYPIVGYIGLVFTAAVLYKGLKK